MRAAITLAAFMIFLAVACSPSAAEQDAGSDVNAGEHADAGTTGECTPAQQRAADETRQGQVEICGSATHALDVSGDCLVPPLPTQPCSDAACGGRCDDACATFDGPLVAEPMCQCVVTCQRASDCGADAQCFCVQWNPEPPAQPLSAGTCVSGCASDADCPAGEGCFQDAVHAPSRFECTTPQDACDPITFEPCTPAIGSTCAFGVDGNARWSCYNPPETE